MKKVLVAYFSSSGITEQMAEYIAEGVRFTGNQAVTRKIATLNSAEDLSGYDGYIFGSPTFSLDLPEAMKSFLTTLPKSSLKGKMVGAFGVYKHEVGYAPGGVAASLIFENLEKEFQMEGFELGPLQLKEDMAETREGIRNCQIYGKAFAEKLR